MARGRRDSRITVYGALTANAAIAASKFIVAATSGSSSLLSEAIHSTVDTGNELLLLLGLHRAGEAPTREHPYGYGKELYFWSFVVAIVIFAGGGGMAIYEGITRLQHGAEASRGFVTKLVVLGIALAFEGGSFFVGARSLRRTQPAKGLWRAMRSSKDPSIYTVVVEDFAAITGILVAFAAVTAAQVLGMPWIDSVGSLVIGAILVGAAFVLAMESRALIVGESAAPRLIDSIRRTAASDPAVRSADCPLTMQLGPDQVLVNLEVQLEPELDAREVVRALHRIEGAIRREHPSVGPLFVTPSAVAE